MTHPYDDTLRSLEEAALLPEGDPRRRVTIDGLGTDGAPREHLTRAWLDILTENEALALRLRNVEVPTGVLERICAAPRAPRAASRALPRGWPSGVVGGMAVAAIVLVVVVWMVVPWGQRGTLRPSAELATLAAMDHAARPEMTILTDDLDALALALGDRVPYELGITSPGPGAVLVGGRVCTFGDRPLVYTCWHMDGRRVAVYQVRRGEFGLAAHQPPSTMDVPARGSRESQCRASVWTDAEFGYVLVHDRAAGPD